MAKTLKAVFISVCAAIVALLAGAFFFGCDINYGIIKLVVDQEQENIELFVGESEELVLDIQNSQKGFDNTISIWQTSDSGVAAVELGEPQYQGSQIKVQITAVAGGHSTITARTLEGNKSCKVEVWVREYATGIETDRSPLYVSGASAFVPESGMFAFSPVTATENDVSFYLVQTLQEPMNGNTVVLESLQQVGEQLQGNFSTGSGILDSRTLTRFDKVVLQKTADDDATESLLFSLEGSVVAENPRNVQKQFQILALYNHSVVLENGNFGQPALGYDKIVSCLATVYVLPNIDATILGGYVQTQPLGTGTQTQKIVKFAPITSAVDIVPNNENMSEFIFKIVENANKNFPISVDFNYGTNIVMDYAKDDELMEIWDVTNAQNSATLFDNKADNVQYFSVTQSTQSFSTSQIVFDIFYDLAKNVDDQSVNLRREFVVNTKIAPKEIAINGETENPKQIVLYNRYNEQNGANYGWVDLAIEVRSGLAAEPVFDTITFELQDETLGQPNYREPVLLETFDGKVIEFSNVYSADEVDLSRPFKIRGVSNALARKLQLVVCVQSNIAAENAGIVENSVDVEVVAGASAILLNNVGSDVYFDLATGGVDFSDRLYADQLFQGISVSFEGDDILDVDTHPQNPCQEKLSAGGTLEHFLNLSFRFKGLGDAVYTFRLDNGTQRTLSVHVINTLRPETTFVQLASSGNDNVTASSVGSSGQGQDFNDLLSLEVLNNSTFGSKAVVTIVCDGRAQVAAGENDYGDILSVTPNGNTFTFTTKANGTATVAITILGQGIGWDFSSQQKTLSVLVKISSYTLVEDFYLTNGADRAVSSTVYWGSSRVKGNSTAFGVVAQQETANNFFRYQLSQEGVSQIWAGAEDFDVLDANFNSVISQTMIEQSYNQQFVYFFASYSQTLATGATRTDIFPTTTSLTIEKLDAGEWTQPKFVNLHFAGGLMFWGGDENGVWQGTGSDGNEYKITFSNVYSFEYGTFDLSSLTYTNKLSNVDYSFTLTAYLSQRDLTNRYGVNINSQHYQMVEYISLASSQSEVFFSNKNFRTGAPTAAQANADLTKNLTVYTLPTNATFNDIQVQFVADNAQYQDMLEYDIDISRASLGIFGVTLSVKNFHNLHADSIMNIQDSLAGTVYIYPREWGSSFSAIDEALQPIVLRVQYLNGSKANPYLLENAEDVRKIGSNRTSLASHYQINSAIDMNSISNFAPIGILDGQVVGFSGSIVGTTAQAAINNINVVQTAQNRNFVSEVVDGNCFAGLFAKISEGATIENISFSGRLNVATAQGTKNYVSILAAQNFGTLTNVQVNISKASTIVADSAQVFFGAVSGANFGTICQDFTKYDGSQVMTDGHDFAGLPSKNLAYFEEFVSLSVLGSANVYAGGIAGANSGRIERILPQVDTYKMYGYTGYSVYTLIAANTNVNTGAGSDSGAGSGTGAGANADARIVLGGAVGIATYYNRGAGRNYLDKNNAFAGSGSDNGGELQNLLVGGEVNALAATNCGNFVGGIAGAVDTLGTSAFDILQNTSRVFLRGDVVGGIVGADVFSTNYASANLANFGTQNKIEAVDDGRNAVLSANIIKTSQSGLDLAQNGTISNLEFAIGGNLLQTGAASLPKRIYSGVSFTALSYLPLSRTKTTQTTDQTSTKVYYGDFLIVTLSNGQIVVDTSTQNAKTYATGTIELGTQKSDFKLLCKGSTPENVDVYYMYYFSLVSSLAQDASQQNQLAAAQAQLNEISPNAQLYPFAFNSQEISISSKTSNLKIDEYGNISVQGVGLCELEISSVLNIMQTRKIFVYVINYFDTKVQTSIFYAAPNSVESALQSGSSLSVVGKSTATAYLVPSYNFVGTTSSGKDFSISQNGVLNFENVNYRLAHNTQVYAKVQEQTSGEGDNSGFVCQVQNQDVVFFKDPNASTATSTQYTLVPYFEVKILIDGKTYTYYLQLDSSQINLGVTYRDAAAAILMRHTKHAITTNGRFTEEIEILSGADEELLFYQIVGPNGQVVQSKMPTFAELQQLENRSLNWKNWIETFGNNSNLFNFGFERDAKNANKLAFECSINKNCSLFINRLKENIYGTYTVTLYSTELEEGQARCTFEIELQEANLGYVSFNNFSNYQNTTVTDNVIVPSQRGLLEVTLDPLDAVFGTFTIANAQQNYQAGAGEASFMIALNTNHGMEIVPTSTFGRLDEGSFSFTYTSLLDLLEEYSTPGETLSYNGKIYIAYYMPANGVMENMPISFDISVTYGTNAQMLYQTSVDLVTKLSSYVRLAFDSKQPNGSTYFVARGLSYNLTLDSFGFSEDQVKFEVSSQYLSLQRVGAGRYVLQVSNLPIDYAGQVGLFASIVTSASKTVDYATVSTSHELRLCIMDYVLNYTYQNGVHEDIVRGMENGVVDVVIGNNFALEIDLQNFLEYDRNSASITAAVNAFLQELSQNVQWTVYFQGAATHLQEGTSLRQEGYYIINGLTFTPLAAYNHESDIYHFSVNGYYVMRNGVYAVESINTAQANQLATEFSFDVHQQSTDESPIPVRNYQEFLDMQPEQWYILLANIRLPNFEQSQLDENVQQFVPIANRIAGLDGNGKKIVFEGTYNFETQSQIGVFESIAEGAVFKNITVEIGSYAIFNVSQDGFNVGLLAAENGGIVSNASIQCASETSMLTVAAAQTDSAVTTTGVVAGLVATNNGFVTNSRSAAKISANANLSGLVGNNNGLIASSYFAGGNLKNGTTSALTAGLVVDNGTNGKIYTSYTNGKITNQDAARPYCLSETDDITSGYRIGGFVYTNRGQISDCYSNVTLRHSSAITAGFVLQNSGAIEKCFSTSVLESRTHSNYGFVYQNSVLVESPQDSGIFVPDGGTIESCYYLVDDFGTADQNDDINVGVESPIDDTNAQITEISVDNMKNPETFVGFNIVSGRNMNGVWFINNDPENVSNFNNARFNISRPELVAPNIIAKSVQVLDKTQEVQDENGATYTRYTYIYSSESPALGSVYNPILVDSANHFEQYIQSFSTSAGYNYNYYRLIADIDYNEIPDNSQLYKTKFLGYLEGNFMEISAISLISTESLPYAGMFAEIGGTTANNIGTVMNLVLSPNAVAFANANVVGAVAGKVENATLVNISLLAQGADTTASGNNIVGGVVGLATGASDLNNLYSQFGARARNATRAAQPFSSQSKDFSQYSYAGGVVGVISGSTKINNIVLDSAVTITGARAGGMFGLLDEGATTENITMLVDQNLKLNAYAYGGLVAGESKGFAEHIVVRSKSQTPFAFSNVSKERYMPSAVGGVAGLVSGGQLQDVDVYQSISLSTESSSDEVKIVGGVAGRVTGSATFKDIYVKADFTGLNTVGAVVGSVASSAADVLFEDVNVDECYLFVVGLKQSEVSAGGIAGEVEEMARLTVQTKETTLILDKQEQIALLQAQIENVDAATKPALESSLAQAQQELETLLSQQKNNIDVDVNIHQYVYSTDIIVNAGAIVGRNASLFTHLISDTNSKITNGRTDSAHTPCFVEDLSYVNIEKATAHVYVQAQEYGAELVNVGQTQGGSTLYPIIVQQNNEYTTRCQCQCDVSFRILSMFEITQKYTMNLNLFGQPVAE